MLRSACPAASARPSIYAAKRSSCGPGVECLPTEQFYTKLFFYNTVVLGGSAANRHDSSNLCPVRRRPRRLLRRNSDKSGAGVFAYEKTCPQRPTVAAKPVDGSQLGPTIAAEVMLLLKSQDHVVFPIR